VGWTEESISVVMFWLVLPIPKYIIYTWGLSGLAGLLNKKKSSKKVKKKGSKKNLCGEGGEGECVARPHIKNMALKIIIPDIEY
jgi:hypothetical protein